MSNDNGVGEIFEKIAEMQDFLRIGDEVIPFLGDLFKFIQDVMPLMSEIQRSFTDSSGKLPDAAKRLNDVSHATEMATHEIMDKLESINIGLDKISNLSESDNEIVETIKNDVMDITFALQFQDITSQKLEHANRILEAINKKFVELSKNSEMIKVKTKVGERIMHELHLGPDPDQANKDSEEFHKETEDVIRENQNFSQDDIDALFG
ncbi:MAG: hypothetical protein JXQ65_15335 [Candidatus Marinimicrobia bacterium]|nr:hypothetical protein [Candidatus Neomarinimicrobiota bacterium]